MREVLIRYLLGELSPEEHDEVHARLQSSPELRQELARLRECFAAHQDEDIADDGPPSGLASRVAERVTCGDGAIESAAGRSGRLTSAGDPPAGFLGWSLADLTVAGGVMLAVSMLIFPALRNSRDETRRVACQNNLRQLYVLCALHAQDHAGFFPQIKANEHAGAFVAQLIGKGYAHPQELRVWLVCPDSPVAAKIRDGAVFDLPNAQQIAAMTPEQLSEFTAVASPSYAYAFPYREAREFRYVKNDRRAQMPVFSDAMGDEESGVVTPNHGSRFFQVQFADGSLKWFKSWKLPGVDEDMSRNNRGRVAAGEGPLDIVLANSGATPGELTGE
jgi:anti-sigma-K factor RskA